MHGVFRSMCGSVFAVGLDELADLRDEIGGFDQARILSTVVTRDDWPPQRAVAGSDLPPGTPVANLWNVGDGGQGVRGGGDRPGQPAAARPAGASSGIVATSALLRSGSRAAAARVITTHAIM